MALTFVTGACADPRPEVAVTLAIDRSSCGVTALDELALPEPATLTLTIVLEGNLETISSCRASTTHRNKTLADLAALADDSGLEISLLDDSLESVLVRLSFELWAAVFPENNEGEEACPPSTAGAPMLSGRSEAILLEETERVLIPVLCLAGRQ